MENSVEKIQKNIDTIMLNLDSDSKINGIETVKTDILKNIVLPLIEELHAIDSLRSKERAEIDLIVKIQEILGYGK